MKNAIVLLTCVLVIAACSQPMEQAKVGDTTTPAADTSNRIPLDSATAARQLYSSFIARVDTYIVHSRVTYDTTFVKQGFHLPVDEIHKMSERLKKEGGTPSVYAMLGIRYDSISRRQQLSLIFQERTSTVDEWTYYDYSRPCPPNCPTDR